MWSRKWLQSETKWERDREYRDRGLWMNWERVWQTEHIKSRLFLKQHPECNRISPLGTNYSTVYFFRLSTRFRYYLDFATSKISRQNFRLCKDYVIRMRQCKWMFWCECQKHSTTMKRMNVVAPSNPVFYTWNARTITSKMPNDFMTADSTILLFDVLDFLTICCHLWPTLNSGFLSVGVYWVSGESVVRKYIETFWMNWCVMMMECWKSKNNLFRWKWFGKLSFRWEEVRKCKWWLVAIATV